MRTYWGQERADYDDLSIEKVCLRSFCSINIYHKEQVDFQERTLSLIDVNIDWLNSQYQQLQPVLYKPSFLNTSPSFSTTFLLAYITFQAVLLVTVQCYQNCPHNLARQGQFKFLPKWVFNFTIWLYSSSVSFQISSSGRSDHEALIKSPQKGLLSLLPRLMLIR